MPFQFLCPHNHLLQGDESQVGMQTQCPICGVVFIIPQPSYPQYPQQAYPQQQYPQQPYPQQSYPQQGYPQQAYPQQPYAPQQPQFAPQQPQFAPQPQQPQYEQYASPPASEPEPEPAVQPGPAPMPLTSDLSDELPEKEPAGLPGGELALGVVHIPCPNGHELETPLEMIGQEVLCPHCGVQFLLRNEDSVEYRQQQEDLEHRRAQFWFNWAIAASVVIGIGLITMFAMMFLRD